MSEAGGSPVFSRDWYQGANILRGDDCWISPAFLAPRFMTRNPKAICHGSTANYVGSMPLWNLSPPWASDNFFQRIPRSWQTDVWIVWGCFLMVDSFFFSLGDKGWSFSISPSLGMYHLEPRELLFSRVCSLSYSSGEKALSWLPWGPRKEIEGFHGILPKMLLAS